MTQQNANLQTAMEDIAVIRQTLEKSKIHFGKLATLFIIFGGTQLLAYVFHEFCKLYFLKTNFYVGIEILSLLKYATLAILFGFFMKMRADIKRSNNIYTLQLFNIWGFLLFAIPLIRFLILPVQAVLYGVSAISNVAVFAYAATGSIEYISVLVGVLATGCILNKPELKGAALLLLFTYPLLFFIGADTVNIDTVMSAYGHFSQVNAVAYLLTLLLYLALGIDFKIYSGGDKIGTE